MQDDSKSVIPHRAVTERCHLSPNSAADECECCSSQTIVSGASGSRRRRLTAHAASDDDRDDHERESDRCEASARGGQWRQHRLVDVGEPECDSPTRPGYGSRGRTVNACGRITARRAAPLAWEPSARCPLGFRHSRPDCSAGPRSTGESGTTVDQTCPRRHRVSDHRASLRASSAIR